MARQMGARSQLLAKFESVYGTAPSGNWQKVPVMTYEVAFAPNLIKDPALGFGHRESLDPFRGQVDVKGPIVVPVDVRYIGLWLKALLGNYSVSGVGPYTHIFKPENSAGGLPSLGVELGHLDVPKYYTHTGLVIDKATFNLAGTGEARVSMDAIAQNEAEGATTGGGTPTSLVYTPFNQLNGTLFRDAAGSTLPATTIGNVISGQLVINNNVNAVPGVGTNGLVLGADPQTIDITGNVIIRFADTTLYDLALAGTYEALSFGYQIDANNSLNIVLPRVSLARTTPKLTGPGGVQAEFQFMASRDAGSSASLIATLVNDVASY